MRLKSTPLRKAQIAAVFAICTTLTACGSGSGSDSSGSSSSDIKVMVTGSFTAGSATAAAHVFPTPEKGVKAAAKAMNAAGGMNGHHVDVIACDNQGNPNLAAACARKAKSEGVIAVVGSFDPVGSAQTLPILTSEGIPYLGATSATAIAYTSPSAWPQDGGGAVAAYGLIANLIDNKCTSVTFLAPDTPLSAASYSSAMGFFKKEGIKASDHPVTFPQGGVDLSPNVSKALNQHSECLWISSTPSDGVKLVQLVRKVNTSVKIFSAYQSIGAGALGSLGSAGDGVNVVSATPLPSLDTPAMQAYKKDMEAAGYVKDEDGFSVTAWSGMQVLQFATKKMSTFTASALKAELPKMGPFTVGGYPEVSYAKPFDNKTYPRLFNRKVEYYVTKGGKFEPVGASARDVTQFINPS